MEYMHILTLILLIAFPVNSFARVDGADEQITNDEPIATESSTSIFEIEKGDCSSQCGCNYTIKSRSSGRGLVFKCIEKLLVPTDTQSDYQYVEVVPFCSTSMVNNHAIAQLRYYDLKNGEFKLRDGGQFQSLNDIECRSTDTDQSQSKAKAFTIENEEEIISKAFSLAQSHRLDAAEQLLRPLANSGNVVGMYNLGLVLAEMKNYDEALRWLSNASRGGMHEAQTTIRMVEQSIRQNNYDNCTGSCQKSCMQIRDNCPHGMAQVCIQQINSCRSNCNVKCR